jgi:hypothetical protein
LIVGPKSDDADWDHIRRFCEQAGLRPSILKVNPAPDYSEFDDVDRSQDPYVNSRKAQRVITNLAHKHGLKFTQNPGGGEYYGAGFRCQVSNCDDIADLAKLRQTIADKM